MSILSALRTAYGYEDAFGAKDSTTQEMRGAIEEWFQLYYNRAQNVSVQTRTLLSVGLSYTFKNK